MRSRSSKPTKRQEFLVGAGGAVLVLICMKLMLDSARAMGFHAVRGRVISSKVESTVGGRINHHTPLVEYSYVVNGKNYRNDVYGPDDNKGTEEWAQSVVGLYPPTAPCTVHYDPDDPQDSVISKRPNSGTIGLLILLTPFGLLCLFGALSAWRCRRRFEQHGLAGPI